MSATVLLAEDDEQLRELLKVILEEGGYRLLVAKNAQEALELANGRHAIDLLISNIQMPGMVGTDLARQLTQSRPSLRVLLISGYSQGVLMLDSGWRFLRKPFSPIAIIEKVEELLRVPPQREFGKARARRNRKTS